MDKQEIKRLEEENIFLMLECKLLLKIINLPSGKRKDTMKQLDPNTIKKYLEDYGNKTIYNTDINCCNGMKCKCTDCTWKLFPCF